MHCTRTSQGALPCIVLYPTLFVLPFCCVPCCSRMCAAGSVAATHCGSSGSQPGYGAEQLNFFSHTGSDGSSPLDRIKRTGYSYRSAAENIAAGYRTAGDVVQGWYNSPGHRQNMLNCHLHEIGVAYADGGSYGRYWTQVFATPR